MGVTNPHRASALAYTETRTQSATIERVAAYIAVRLSGGVGELVARFRAEWDTPCAIFSIPLDADKYGLLRGH